MAFEGFTNEDFEIFDLPDFGARMPVLKANITPKLKQIGEEILPRVSRIAGHKIHPHVAQHLRRSVNPAEETWVAFSREKRAYKPFVHLRVAINGGALKLTCHLEDYARDKETFARRLMEESDRIGAYLADHDSILSHDLHDPYGKPMAGRSLNAETLRDFAHRLQTIKSQHASFAIRLDRLKVVKMSSDKLLDRCVKELRLLKPIYDLGIE
ncbi:MAG: DUF1054 family protein [Chthonomonadales bacterium]